jgi:elongation of very long chain fatty acids protein 6
MLKSPWVPIVACLLYGLFIVAGQAYFSTRPPWNLRKLLAVWNLALSVFSFVGLVRVLPAILHMWATYTRKENFCMDPESSFGSGSTGLWVQLFILSKLPYVNQEKNTCLLLYASISSQED